MDVLCKVQQPAERIGLPAISAGAGNCAWLLDRDLTPRNLTRMPRPRLALHVVEIALDYCTLLSFHCVGTAVRQLS